MLAWGYVLRIERGRLFARYLWIHDCGGADPSAFESWNVFRFYLRGGRRQLRTRTLHVGARERQIRKRTARHAIRRGIRFPPRLDSATRRDYLQNSELPIDLRINRPVAHARPAILAEI